jgi:two-component system sensor histidine kinase KdpD
MHPDMRDFGWACGAVALATAVGFAMYPFLAPANIVMMYLLAVLFVAARGKPAPAILASVLGVLAFDWCFVPPRFSFTVSDVQYLFTFAVMLAVALVITRLATRLKEEALQARQAELRTAAMHGLSRGLAATRGVEAVIAAAISHLSETFACRITLLLPDEKGVPRPRGGGDADEKEASVAKWVLDSGRTAGLGTSTLPDVPVLFTPLIGARGPVGVARLEPKEPGQTLQGNQIVLLESFGHQIGLALEVDRLYEEARQALLEAEKERLRASLLSSVSHDLRTPLAGIIGSATTLLESSAPGSAKSRELLENIQTEGERLSKLVHNLIETTRLESGEVRLRKEPFTIEELVGSALARLEKPLEGRKVSTDVPEDLPLVPLDSVLIEQVLVNLLDNACRHTPPGTPIELSAALEGTAVKLEVEDHGPGLAPGEQSRVFEKFYHASSPAAGAGLGLAICKAVVEAHGGRIWAENRLGGGASFQFTLPIKEAHAARR